MSTSNAYVAGWVQAVRVLQLGDNQGGSQVPRATPLGVSKVLDQLQQQPTPPKAVWKKLVQQAKVPLHLASAFSTASQHSWESPATRAGIASLLLLLRKAVEADIVKIKAGTSSLGSSIRQQLQQGALLQHLAAFMAALAGHLQAEAARLATCAGGWGAAGAGIQDRLADVEMWQADFVDIARLLCLLDGLWRSPAQSQADAGTVAWLSDPSGWAVAAMQLSTAALQHVSGVLQHVLSVLQERAPQAAEALLTKQQDVINNARLLAFSTLCELGRVIPPRDEGRRSALQRLLRSPHRLLCAAAMVALSAARIGAFSQAAASSSSEERSSRGGEGRHARQRGRADAAAAAASARADSNSLTACQRQLLELLGLSSLPTAGLQPCTATVTVYQLCVAVTVCFSYAAADAEPPAQPAGPPQQQHFGRLLLMLLPTVLLPCASALVPASGVLAGPEGAGPGVPDVLELSMQALFMFGSLQLKPHVEPLRLPAAVTPDGWMAEMLSSMLRLADQLQPQQPQQQGAASTDASGSAAAAATAAAAMASTAGSGSPAAELAGSMCVAQLLAMLSTVVEAPGLLSFGTHSSGSSSSSGSGDSGRNSSSSEQEEEPVGPLLLLAEGWIGIAAAIEQCVRSVAGAVERGVPSSAVAHSLGSSVGALLLGDSNSFSMFERHMGLCGPGAFGQELRQMYSLASCVLKLGCGRTGAGQLCWVEQLPGCCLAAGVAAAWVLEMVLAAGDPGACQTEWHAQQAAAASQQPAVDYLPSLVIFGRCCLFWAQQLQQQAPELLLLAAGGLQQEQRAQVLLHPCGAACVCIPYLRQRSAIWHDCSLERICAVVSGWVADPKSAAAHAQLAAAGCGPQQLQQQLNALLAAQQGTQQQQGGLTDASLAALVQQLQATGAMLSSIAVPHFCNHAACANLSGPTEVGLVSGRSCLCGGCRVARYCGRRCQRLAWAQHKSVCRALQAAAAAAAAAVPPGC